MRACRAQQCARFAAQLRWRGTTTVVTTSKKSYATESAAKQDGREKSISTPTSSRFNELGIQQVSDSIYSQLFRDTPEKPLEEYTQLSKDHLNRHDLLGKTQDNTPAVGFETPPLYGNSLDEHFHKLGLDAAEPYLTLSKDYAIASPPRKPRKWIKRSGWTKYYPDGSSEPVASPNESAITFDTEVMYKETSFPAMACAVSSTAWYAWMSPWLLGESDTDRHLIPLGNTSSPQVVVGHNIGYDRARIKEEYSLDQSKISFLDTMSLHVAVNGMCTRQRPTWMKHRKARDLRDEIAKSAGGAGLHSLIQSRSGDEDDEEEHLWIGRSSVNSLRDVAQFHCGITIDKSRREWFGELDRDGVMQKYDELLDYCAADVEITHRVYSRVFPAFLETCPHPVSFAALRHLSSEILPVNETWENYIENAENTYEKALEDVQKRLVALSDRALEIKDNPSKYQNDPWLSQLDWSGQEIKMVKGKKKGDPPRPAKGRKMPGMPAWYKDLFPKKSGPMNLTVRTRTAPLLLRLSWDGYPLVWSQKHGWTFRVPISQAGAYANKAVVECDMAEEEENPQLRWDTKHKYFKLPHKDGPNARCISPLAKGYLQHFEKGTLSSEYPYAKEALQMNASCSYWISARDRIKSQMVVYDEDIHPVKSSKESGKKQGYILPQLIPMGTITRRAVENTWLTASNAKSNRVGSELKSMITAPPGYVFVGADVDSQELWIASIMGDSQFKIHGGNALGFMTLEGDKAAGTDLHSRTAKILGISRNDAKVFNYGRIYGAGLNFAGTLLKQFNPDLTTQETNEIASKLYAETKGSKILRKVLRARGFWYGGTESLVFNTLEDFAEQDKPRTPVLGAGITEALMRRYISKGEFMTSRVNWAIQSSGVDYLHLLIVSMDYLSRRYNIDCRLAITVHDEIRYLVKEKDKYRAAMALQISNLWTRAMFSQQIGINDLPQSCAFFSSVDIDHVLRKEVDMDCVTPSHPTPIPPGESIDISTLLAKGPEARLDPSITPRENEEPKPEMYEYKYREPVMKQLQRENGFDLDYLRAQIASSNEEIKEILKSKKKGIENNSEETSSSTTTTTSSNTATPTPRRPRTKHTTRTNTDPEKPQKRKTNPMKKIKPMSTPKKNQPKGIFLHDVPPSFDLAYREGIRSGNVKGKESKVEGQGDYDWYPYGGSEAGRSLNSF